MVKVDPDVLMYSQGETIFEEGTSGNRAYLIVSGEVCVFKRRGNREVFVARLGQGSLIGEICLLEPGAKRTATVIVFTDKVEVKPLSHEQFKNDFQKFSPKVMHLLASLQDRLQESYSRIVSLS